MRDHTESELLEMLSSLYNISPAQLKLVCEEFNSGRGSVVINAILDHRYKLDKLNGVIK